MFPIVQPRSGPRASTAGPFSARGRPLRIIFVLTEREPAASGSPEHWCVRARRFGRNGRESLGECLRQSSDVGLQPGGADPLRNIRLEGGVQVVIAVRGNNGGQHHLGLVEFQFEQCRALVSGILIAAE
jgi:hypothetical protein